MTKKKSKPGLLKFTLLLSIRESYLFCRNLLGLKEHPFRTLREIVEDQDYSQALLIFGLPFNLLVFGTATIFLSRLLIGKQGKIGWLAQSSLFFLTLFCFLLFVYLAYWFRQVWHWRKNGQQ